MALGVQRVVNDVEAAQVRAQPRYADDEVTRVGAGDLAGHVARLQLHAFRDHRSLDQCAGKRTTGSAAGRIAAVRRSVDYSWGLGLAALVVTVILAACGGSSSGSPSPSAPATPVALATPKTTAAPASCPTAARVGSALGITLPKPVGVPATGSTSLPAGATGIVCEYHAATYNVIIVRLTNISPSDIAQFSAKFPSTVITVSGVGDQAFAFSAPLGGGKDNEGVVATKGTTLVAITATDTPASLAQIEALVSQLL
jgi:hypothetical protein